MLRFFIVLSAVFLCRTGFFRMFFVAGFATIPSGGGGTFIGGYLIKRFDLRCAGILKLCLVTSCTALMLTFSFLVRCPNILFAGVNIDYAQKNLWVSDFCCNFSSYVSFYFLFNSIYFFLYVSKTAECNSICTGYFGNFVWLYAIFVDQNMCLLFLLLNASNLLTWKLWFQSLNEIVYEAGWVVDT